MTISRSTLQFLKDLRKNNNREWFNENKDRYTNANQEFIAFIQHVISLVGKFDKTVSGLDAKKCVFRIYRDTRFSADKSPYKTNFGAALNLKGSGSEMAGYYIHIEPGKSFLVGGSHMTEPEKLKAIREDISDKNTEFLKIINEKNFKSNFTLEGERLVNVPRGFAKDDPMAEYLKFKEYMVSREVDDRQVLADDFPVYCAGVFKMMKPLNEFLNKA